MFLKIALAVIVVLSLACGYLFLTKQTTDANLKNSQIELNEANKRVETQKTTIDLMTKDAKTQADLLAKYSVSVTDIRKIASDNLSQIQTTDFGKVANTNALELEKTINDRTQQLFDGITKLSQGNQ